MITTKEQIKKLTNLRYGGRTPYGILLLFFLLCTTFGVAQEFRVIDNKGTIRTVTSNSVTTSATAPSSPVEGDVWFDTTTNISKIYDADSTSWLTIDEDTVSVSTTTPATPEEGDIWFDTTNDITKVYDGNAWQEVQAASALALWDKDTDTGIQVEETGDEDKIRFDTANAERMIIDENGNVGIGTDSPTNTFDVNGKARVRTLTDETSNDAISIVSVNDDGVLSKIERYWKQSDETRTQSSTNLFTSSMTATQPTTYAGNGADRAINGNTSSGERSITGGQVFPWWKLDMGSEITLNRLRFYQYGSSQNRLSNFYVIFSKTDINLPATPTQTDVDNLVNNNDSVQYSGQIPNQSGDVEFSDKEARYIIVVRNISTADYLQMAEVQGFEDTLSYAGITTDKEKVGIGTSSPSEKLDVDGGARIRTLNTGAATDEVVVADTNGVLKKRSLSDVVQEPWFGDDDDAAATTNTEDIYHMGQVGIGTTDPSDDLHVEGDARITGALKDGNNEAGTSGQILSSTATGTDWIDVATALWDADTNTGVQLEESADENKIRFDTAGKERMLIDETGKVGIATSQLNSATLTIGSLQQAPTSGTSSEIITSFESFDVNNFSYINSRLVLGVPASLFDDDTEGNGAFDARRDVAGQDWGIAYAFDSEYQITQVRLQARNNCCGGRTGGGVIQVLRGGSVVATSSVIAAAGGTSQWTTAYAPNVIGDEVRYIFENGVNVSDGTADLNFSEFEILGQELVASTEPVLLVEGDARITGALKDSNDEAGASGQILSSTATGTDWIDVATPTALWDADTNTGVQVEEGADENKIRFDTAGNERMIIDNAGRVGVGTATPDALLHLNGGNNAGIYFSDETNAGNNLRLAMYHGTAGGKGMGITWNDAINGNEGGMIFQSLNNAGSWVSDLATLTRAGEFGIGTTAPDSDIHKYSVTAQGNLTTAGQMTLNDDKADLILERRHSSTNQGGGLTGPMIDFRTNNTSGNRFSLAQIIGLADSGGSIGYGGGLSFLTSPGGTVNPTDSRSHGGHLQTRMIIQADGNIGIGTTSPTDDLHVEGDARITGALKDGNDEAGASGQILSSTATGTDWIDVATPTALWDTDTNTGIQVEESTNEDKIRFDTAGTERLILDEEGRLLFANPGDFTTPGVGPSAVLGIDDSNNTHGRLRITAGSQDTFNDTEGASIDLHGNSATSNTGVLDLVAGQAASGTNAAIKLWTNSTGAFGGQATRMVVTGNGNVGIGNATPNANAILDLTNSDDKAFLLPTETLPTTINSPTDGMLVYSSTNTNAYLRADSAWKPIAYNAVTNEQIFDGDDDADTSNDDFYYVSMVINGAWKVIRYNKTDVNDEKEATVSNNAVQTTQPTDLATCTGLTYN